MIGEREPVTTDAIEWPKKTHEINHRVCDSARWNGFKFRHDDIVIGTWSKTGTTWMQQIVALIATSKHRDLDNPLPAVLTLLATDTPLPAKYVDHALRGEWKDFRDCHVKPISCSFTARLESTCCSWRAWAHIASWGSEISACPAIPLGSQDGAGEVCGAGVVPGGGVPCGCWVGGTLDFF
jgi:hypothetical protein